MGTIRPILALALLAAACADADLAGPTCEPGAVAACPCSDGRTGLQGCDRDGTFEACACDALAVEPAWVDFGRVAPGARVEATVGLAFRGDAGLPIRAATLATGADFELVEAPERVPGGGAAALFVIAFTPPADVARATDVLRVELDVEGYPPLEIPVAGESWLDCEVRLVDFGEVESGLEVGRSVRCYNRNDARGVELDSIEVEGESFAVVPPGEDHVGRGEPFDLTVLHHARGEGAVEGTLAIRFADPVGVIELPLRARDVYRDCALTLRSPFLRLLPGGEARGELSLSPGERDCAIRAIRTEDCDPAFRLEGWPGGIELRERVALPVVVQSDRAGTVSCTVVLEVVDAEEPVRRLALEARVGWDACLDVDLPTSVGFQASAACTDETFVRPVNVCRGPVTVAGVGVEGPASFAATVASPLPVTLAPGEGLAVELAYSPLATGAEHAELVLRGPGDERLVLPLEGTTLDRVRRVDSWNVGPMDQLDVLVVVDDGAGLAAEEERVIAALGSLPERLRGWFDYHLAVTTSSSVPSPACGGGGGQHGRLVPVDGSRPRVVTPETADGRAVWEANLRVGACHDGPNLALEAANRALHPPLVDGADDPSTSEPLDGNAGFFRRDAALLLVLVGDREDDSPGTTRSRFEDIWYLKGIWTAKFGVAVIAGDPVVGCAGPSGEAAAPAERWLWPLDAVPWGGTFASICSVQGPVPLPLPERRRCFFFSSPVADVDGDGAITDAAGELQLYVGGVPVASIDDDGATVWSATAESVCFAEGHEPGWNRTVTAEYEVCPRWW